MVSFGLAQKENRDKLLAAVQLEVGKVKWQISLNSCLLIKKNITDKALITKDDKGLMSCEAWSPRRGKISKQTNKQGPKEVIFSNPRETAEHT